MLMNHAQFEVLFAGLDWRRVRAIGAKAVGVKMQKEFDEMLDKLETGAFVYVEPSSKMLEFNEYM
ncbi:MAG: hypothetical protein Q4G26_14160, partial [Paracoccus sp. (in: a-proteobacteria)]|nr:hypothetical protein [Paracoccus sp. (in: a-proteobacteria)]